MFFLCKMDSSIWWETNRSVRRQLPCALNFVLFYWAAFCRFGFRISLPFQSGLKSEHINIQSSSIHASFGFQIQVSSTCNSLPITNSSSCLTSSPRPFMCCLCVAERKIWTCRRVEEDQWSGYRFQTNFQLLVLAELRYIQRLTEATLKAPLLSQFLSAAHISTCTSCSCQVGNDLHMSLMSIYASEHKKK